MNKKVKIAIIVLVIILLALVVYNYYKKRKAVVEAPANTNNGGTTGNTTGTTTNVTVKNDNFPLQRGSFGPNVKYLQQAINRLSPSANLTEDGDFGPSTYTQFLLTIGTMVNIDGVVYSAYPVTQKVFTEILQEANTARVVNPTLNTDNIEEASILTGAEAIM